MRSKTPGANFASPVAAASLPVGPDSTLGGAGSRAIAQFALSDCPAVTALRMTRRDPALVARAIYGDEIVDEGSRIALAVGRQFESALKRRNFERFRHALDRAGRLTDASSAVIADIDALAPGESASARTERARLTSGFLLRAVRGDQTAPDVLWHPHVALDLGRFPITIVPDYLLMRHTAPGLRVGEIKAYPDRGAATSIASLRLARLQAGVEVLAVRATLLTLGVRDAESHVTADVDIMLRTRGLGLFGVLRREPARVHREVERLERSISDAVVALPGLVASMPAGITLDQRAGFEALPYRYSEQCRGHCALAQRCGERAVASGNPAILGDHMAASLGGVISLTELDAILAGLQEPRSPEASVLARAYAAALRYTGHPVVGDGRGSDAVEISRAG